MSQCYTGCVLSAHYGLLIANGREVIPASDRGLNMRGAGVRAEVCPRGLVGAVVPEASLQALGPPRRGLE